jgi:serine protease Do
MTPRTSRYRRPAFAAALLAASALSGVAGWSAAPALAQAAPAAAATSPISVDRPAAQALPGFADLAQRVGPAVVTITTTSRQAAEDGGSPFEQGSPGDRRFGQYFGGREQGAARTVHALGSGFIVDAGGHIVTNNHVVKDATDIHVTLADGREMAAKVVGTDARTDLAVLQVKSDQPLPHLALGDSDAARVGDWVVAVGNPFGLGGTVTAGILSARGREIGQGPYDDFLQVDAPINRGNSGGPLFAQDGTVIGVNTAIFSPSGGSVGIGFAIPANLVKQVVGQLEAHGTVQRGWLGIGTQPVTPVMAAALHLPKPGGALVTQVEAGSPAARAGVQPGDVVTAVAGQPVRDPRGLARIVAGLQPGADAQVVVQRDGQDRTLTAPVTALRDKAAAAAMEAEHGPALGLALAPLDQRSREALNLPAGEQGVVVAGVKQDSPAEEAGLKAGDLLKAVGARAVETPQEAVAALKAAGTSGGAVALRVVRDGQNAFVALRLPGADGQG